MTAAEVDVRLLLALAVVVLAARAVGWLAVRAGQPRVIGEIVAGIALGPSLLGAVAPDALAFLFPPPVVTGLQTLAKFGLVLFMLLVGMHLDIPAVRRERRAVAVVAPVSILVPFGLAAVLGLVIHPEYGGATDPVAFSLFLGSATAVTALPVLARLLVETGLAHTRLGAVSLACAAVNDIVAWCLVAVVVAVGAASGVGGTVAVVVLAGCFVAVLLLVVRPLLARVPDLPTWAVLVLAVGCAWVAERIGIHAIIGAFLAGTVVPRRPAWQRAVDDRLDVVVRTVLLPVFFAVAGLAARVDRLTAGAFVLAVVVVVVATVGKLGAAAVAARTAGESWPDALTLGVLMNTRGVTELVILSVGLQAGLIDSVVYTVMVLMALVTTVSAAPLLALVRRHGPDVVSGPAPDRPCGAGSTAQ